MEEQTPKLFYTVRGSHTVRHEKSLAEFIAIVPTPNHHRFKAHEVPQAHLSPHLTTCPTASSTHFPLCRCSPAPVASALYFCVPTPCWNKKRQAHIRQSAKEPSSKQPHSISSLPQISWALSPFPKLQYAYATLEDKTNLLPLLPLAANYTEEENSRLYHLQGCVRLPGEAERAIRLEGRDLHSRPSAPAAPASRPRSPLLTTQLKQSPRERKIDMQAEAIHWNC